MPTLIDLSNQLNDYLQISLFQDFCPNGIQVEGKREVKRIATAVTASLKVIQKAAESGFDMLIVHHGLFWQKDSYVIERAKREKLEILLKEGISLLAYHLPLDAHRQIGNNWKAALDLGWRDLEPFYAVNKQWIGVKGRFDKTSRENFQKQLEKYYGQKAVFAPGGKESIETCALISGGAYRQIEEASLQNLDCFVTGNYDEPAWHMAHEGRINFFAMGHAATEVVGPKALAQFITDSLGVEATFLPEFNPF